MAHPAYGCNRHAVRLALGRIRVSAITISTLLDDRGLGTRVERWLAQEAKNADMAIEITPEPAASLEKLDPRFSRLLKKASPRRPALLAGEFCGLARPGTARRTLGGVLGW